MAAPGGGTADGIGRRAVLLGGLAIGAGAPWWLAGCGDDGGSGEPGAEGAEGDGADGAGDAGDLLDRLAADGDVEALDRTYASTGANGSPALVVALAGTDAVAYLCDPLGPASWFTGEVGGDRLELVDGRGGTLAGTIAGDACSVELDGTTADGAYELPATDEATLARSSEAVGDGQPGGLIIDGTVATGSFRLAAPSGLLSAASTVGVRVAAGRTLDIAVHLDLIGDARSDVDELTARIAELDDRIDELQEMARKVQDVANRIEALLPRVLDALRTGGGSTNCGEVTAVSGVLVAVVVQVVAQVVAQITAGIPDTSVVERAVVGVAGRADPVPGALELIAANDRTEGQLVLQTVRQSLRRLGTLPGTTAGSSTTTTTAPPRSAPAPGSVDASLGTT